MEENRTSGPEPGTAETTPERRRPVRSFALLVGSVFLLVGVLGHVHAELLTSQVEASTGVCEDLDEVRGGDPPNPLAALPEAPGARPLIRPSLPNRVDRSPGL